MNLFLITSGLINGLVVGAVYALIGCSLNVLYGVLRVVNFAHGEFIIAGTFVSYVLYHGLGIHPLLAIPVAAAAFFLFGYRLYYLLVPRLKTADDPELASFLMMYGVSLIAAATMLFIFGADSRAIDYTFRPIAIRIGPIFLPTARLAALGVSVAIGAALTWFFYRTLAGKALRAAIMNPEAIQMVGVNIDRLSAGAFGLAAALAGVTGVMIGLVFPAFTPFSGPDYTLIGFIVIVLGGLGHPVGALLGGVLFGLAEQMATVFMPQALSP
ncbi:MAG: branched-chain amino acid ABC transporter permease, partial [Nevskiales bacterium]